MANDFHLFQTTTTNLTFSSHIISSPPPPPSLPHNLYNPNMESKTLQKNTISILPWILVILLLSTIFLLLGSRSPNPFFLTSKEAHIHPPTLPSLSQNNITATRVSNTTVSQIADQSSDSSGERCDLFTGQWVKDPRRPLYTNLTCPTITPNENCLLHGKDGGYIYWRWKPDGCELPRFEPRVFLDIVRGKKMAFIGDSVSGNQMQSLLCLLTQEETPIETFKDVKHEFKTLYFPNYNFSLMFLRTNFLVEATERIINGKGTSAFDIQLDKISTIWTERLVGVNYAIISGGNWYIRKNYLYEDGTLIGCTSCKEQHLTQIPFDFAIRMVFRTTLDFLIKQKENKGMLTLLRTYSPSHFEHGSWFDGGYCNRTQPLSVGESKLSGSVLQRWKVQVEEMERVRKGETGDKRFGLLDVSRAMNARVDGHPSFHLNRKVFKDINDCLHWCLPGPVDTWNEILLEIIKRESLV